MCNLHASKLEQMPNKGWTLYNLTASSVQANQDDCSINRLSAGVMQLSSTTTSMSNGQRVAVRNIWQTLGWGKVCCAQWSWETNASIQSCCAGSTSCKTRLFSRKGSNRKMCCKVWDNNCLMGKQIGIHAQQITGTTLQTLCKLIRMDAQLTGHLEVTSDSYPSNMCLMCKWVAENTCQVILSKMPCPDPERRREEEESCHAETCKQNKNLSTF